MQRINGAGPADVTCRGCIHLRRFRNKGRVAWMKCSRVYVTASSATDWRAGWAAIAEFQERFGADVLYNGPRYTDPPILAYGSGGWLWFEIGPVEIMLHRTV